MKKVTIGAMSGDKPALELAVLLAQHKLFVELDGKLEPLTVEATKYRTRPIYLWVGDE